MNWVLFIGGTWAVVSCVLALIIGRSIGLANQTAAKSGPDIAMGSAVAPPPPPAPVIEKHSPAHCLDASPSHVAEPPAALAVHR